MNHDKYILKITNSSPLWIVVFFSLFNSMLSVFVVFLCSVVFSEVYTLQLFKVSMILPLITTPIIVIVLLGLTKHLKYFKEHLEEEVEQNKKKDVMLFEQARFVLMGEMMANISHQWKQPLNTINLAVFTAKTSNPSEKDLAKYFDIMEDNVNYLAATIDDFMSFFDQKTHLEIRNLENIVKEIKSIIKVHIQNKGIDLEVIVDTSYGDVMIASSISQVALNLLNNAKDAFTDDIQKREIILKLSTTEKGLVLECCDSGQGIDDAIKDKIFDPYFTTKSKQQGTGIGLYMTKQIIQKVFDGIIELNVQCTFRSGCANTTCFHIEIPYSKNCILKERK